MLMRAKYLKDFYANWSDMDFNAHMRNTAYLDKSADMRMMFFSENGFPMKEFMRLKIGPVITKDEIEYYREARLMECMQVDLSLSGLSKDGSRWIMTNEFYNDAGKKLAQVTSNGVWLRLTNRKIVEPPENLLRALGLLPKSDYFKEL